MALTLRVPLLIVIVVASTTLPKLQPAAWAGGLGEKDKASLRQATRFFKRGMYEQAATILSDLAVDHPEMASLQRNLGACYYYLRQPAPALSNLRAYLVKKGSDITPDDKAEVDSWIEEMDTLRAQNAMPQMAEAPQAKTASLASQEPDALLPQGTNTTVPPAQPVVPSNASPPVPAQPPPPSPSPVPSAAPLPPYPVVVAAPPRAQPLRILPPEETSRGSSLRPLGYATLTVGTVAMVAGVTAGLKSRSISDELSKSPQFSARRDDEGKLYNKLQYYGYAAGGIAMAGGLLMILFGGNDSAVALLPTGGPGYASGSVQLLF